MIPQDKSFCNEVEARLAAAPGPWELVGWGYEDATVIMPDNVSCKVMASAVGRSIERQQSGAAYKTADLIVHSPADLRRLLKLATDQDAQIGRLQTTIRELRRITSGWQKHADRLAGVLGCMAMDDQIEKAAILVTGELASLRKAEG